MEQSLEEIFEAYARYGKTPSQLKNQLKLEIDGRTLVKLAKQSKLINNKLRANDVDLIFAKCKTKGKRTINFFQFEQAIKEFAKKRAENVENIQNKIIKAGAPKSNATKADNVKFHDDKSLYTGTWKNGMFHSTKFIIYSIQITKLRQIPYTKKTFS